MKTVIILIALFEFCSGKIGCFLAGIGAAHTILNYRYNLFQNQLLYM